jgi:Rrf2 family protein
VLIRLSAKTDYALRAALELARVEGSGMLKGEQIADAQGIPLKFLLSILTELRNARIVLSHRGANGGFRLARPPADITVADVVRAVDRPGVHEPFPESVGAGGPVQDLWVDVQRSVEGVLTDVTLRDLAARRISAQPVPSP